MAGSWSAFAKTVLVPMLIALSLYIVVFLVALPLYRRHRSHLTRYSDYTPLSTSLAQRTTSLFEPYLIEPSKTLMQKLRDGLIVGLRWVLIPRARRWETGTPGANSSSSRAARAGNDDDEDEDEEGGLFDVESGEAMVGFDVQQDERGRGRQRSNGDTGHVDVVDSNQRLGRELEEGFRDDSGSEASDEEVTVGRRSVSRRRDEVWR